MALACGGDLSLAWLGRFFRGLAGQAIKDGCEINGGDLTGAAPGTFVSTLTLLGSAERPLPRQGGAPGSSLWVTGSLGGSILGHHLHFTPRLAEGLWLAERREVVAAMDLTDGPARDIPEMIPPGLQARIDLAFVPVADAARAAAQDSGLPAARHAFVDGEDYELAFITAPGTDTVRFEEDWREAFPETPLAPIGTLHPHPQAGNDQANLLAGLDGDTLFPGEGFEHFR